MPATSGDPPGALAISEVVRLTGLTTATLRVWQRRDGWAPAGRRRAVTGATARRTSPGCAPRGSSSTGACRPRRPSAVAAGPGWHGTALPDGVERVDDLRGAVQMISQALASG